VCEVKMFYYFRIYIKVVQMTDNDEAIASVKL